VGRSNDTTGTADNLNHNSCMAYKQVICSYPCMDSTCKYHPIAAPVDGTMCRYVNCFGSEWCKRK